jgi:uncharacterized membrane protein YdjX (TVP38/TMEM64 family)
MSQVFELTKTLLGSVKFWILLAIIAAAVLLQLLFGQYVSLETLIRQEATLRAWQRTSPLLMYGAAFALEVVVTGLSLPLATIISLIYAWFFGFWPALVIVSFGSTTGATVAFLMSRYFLRSAIQRRFGDRLAGFNTALQREGAFYLLTLRLLPIVPFWMINLVMGLTSIGVGTFWWVSQVGMLPGTAIYVYAGASIPDLQQINNPYELRATDIRNWPSLVHQLAAAAESDSPSPAKRLWELLGPQPRDTILMSSKSGKLRLQARLELAQALDQALRDPDLYEPAAWREIEIPAAAQRWTERQAAGQKLSQEQVVQWNRLLLQAAFPQQIRAPQPIVNPRLFGALLLLGLFPLAIKKLVSWWRPAPDKAIEPRR